MIIPVFGLPTNQPQGGHGMDKSKMDFLNQIKSAHPGAKTMAPQFGGEEDAAAAHYETKPGHFETLKIHFPTSEGVS